MITGTGKMVDQNSTSTKTLSSPEFIVKSSICTTPLYKNESFLRRKYEAEGLSARQIAVLSGSAHSTINEALKTFGIIKTARIGGRVPFGWKMVSGVRVPHIRQQKIVAQIQRRKKSGWSISKIIVWLRSKRIVGSSGELKWDYETVNKIIRDN